MPYSNFTSCSPNDLFLFEYPAQDLTLHLIVMATWSPLICDSSSSVFPYPSWPWYFGWVLVSYLYLYILSILICLIFSPHWIKVMHSRQKYQKSDFVSFICIISGVLIYCTTDGINLDHLVKLVSAIFLNYKYIFFLL